MKEKLRDLFLEIRQQPELDLIDFRQIPWNHPRFNFSMSL